MTETIAAATSPAPSLDGRPKLAYALSTALLGTIAAYVSLFVYLADTSDRLSVDRFGYAFFLWFVVAPAVVGLQLGLRGRLEAARLGGVHVPLTEKAHAILERSQSTLGIAFAVHALFLFTVAMTVFASGASDGDPSVRVRPRPPYGPIPLLANA